MSLRLAPIQIAMIALCVLMAALFVYEFTAAPAEYALPEIHLKPRVVATETPPAFLPLPESAFDAINDHPVFLPSRKPVAAPPEKGAAPSGPPPLPQIALAGVVLLGGPNSIAEIKMGSAPYAQALHQGESVGGWQIDQILPDRIILKSGTYTQEVHMDAHAGAPPPPGTPGAPGTPGGVLPPGQVQ